MCGFLPVFGGAKEDDLGGGVGGFIPVFGGGKDDDFGGMGGFLPVFGGANIFSPGLPKG